MSPSRSQPFRYVPGACFGNGSRGRRKGRVQIAAGKLDSIEIELEDHGVAIQFGPVPEAGVENPTFAVRFHPRLSELLFFL